MRFELGTKERKDVDKVLDALPLQELKIVKTLIPIGVGLGGAGALYAAWAFSRWVGGAFESVEAAWSWLLRNVNNAAEATGEAIGDTLDFFLYASGNAPDSPGGVNAGETYRDAARNIRRRNYEKPADTAISRFLRNVESQRSRKDSLLMKMATMGCEIKPLAPLIAEACISSQNQVDDIEGFLRTAAEWIETQYGEIGYESSKNARLISELNTWKAKGLISTYPQFKRGSIVDAFTPDFVKPGLRWYKERVDNAFK